MRKDIVKIGRRIIVSIIEKIKICITNEESYDERIIAGEYKNNLSYEEYILRSRISVFKFRKD